MYSATPESTTDEILKVVTEANRLAREGGTPEEREAMQQLKARLLARLEASTH